MTTWTEGQSSGPTWTEGEHGHGPTWTEKQSITQLHPFIERSAGAGTAYIFVDVGDENTVADYDIYICHNSVDLVVLGANVPVMSKKLCYSISTNVPKVFLSAFWVGMRAAIDNSPGGENHYFHTSLPYDITTRLPYDADLWYVRPSATLGTLLGDYFATAVPAGFDGTYVDQSFADLPTGYWTDYQTADDIVGNQAVWEANLDAFMAAFFTALKGSFGSARAVIANTAGGTFPGIDGITIERGHIISEGVASTLATFDTQRAYWEANEDRYGVTGPLNIAFDYDLNIQGLVYRGTNNGLASPDVELWTEAA